jgi:hypothetical protein
MLKIARRSNTNVTSLADPFRWLYSSGGTATGVLITDKCREAAR